MAVVFEDRAVRGYLSWDAQLKLLKKRKFKNKAFEKYRKSIVSYEKKINNKLNSRNYLYGGLLNNYTMRSRHESETIGQRNDNFLREGIIYFRNFISRNNFSSVQEYETYLKLRSLAVKGRMELRRKNQMKVIGCIYHKPIKKKVSLLYACDECNLSSLTYIMYKMHLKTLTHILRANILYAPPIGVSTKEIIVLESSLLKIGRKIESGKITYEEYNKLLIERDELELKLRKERDKGPGVLKRKGVMHPYPERAPKEKKKAFRRGPGWFSKESLLKTFHNDIPPEALNSVRLKSPRRRMRKVVNNSILYSMEREPEYIKSPECSPEAFIFPKYDDATYGYVEFSPYFTADINLIDQ